MASIPTDVIHNCILPRVPIKSLLRFKCVSKSFRTLISSDEFIRKQHKHALSSDLNRLLILPRSYRSCYLFGFDDSLDTPPSVCPYPDLARNSCTAIVGIVASSECFLLISSGFTNLSYIALLNPSTRTFWVIGDQQAYKYIPENSYNIQYGLFHDEPNNDCKVVRLVDYYRNREVIVYSFQTNKWKEIEDKERTDCMRAFRYDAANVNGYLLNVIFSSWDDTKMRIGCFDMRAEQWTDDIILPDILVNDAVGRDFNLGTLDRHLCLMVKDECVATGTLWIMKEYGVKGSWMKLTTSIPLSTDPEFIYGPLAFGMDHKKRYRAETVPNCFGTALDMEWLQIYLLLEFMIMDAKYFLQLMYASKAF